MNAADDDTEFLFERAEITLRDYFGYGSDESHRAVREFRTRHLDPASCRAAGVSVQDRLEWLHQEGATTLGFRVHYTLVVRGDSSESSFIAWLNQKRQQMRS